MTCFSFTSFVQAVFVVPPVEITEDGGTRVPNAGRFPWADEDGEVCGRSLYIAGPARKIYKHGQGRKEGPNLWKLYVPCLRHTFDRQLIKLHFPEHLAIYYRETNSKSQRTFEMSRGPMLFGIIFPLMGLSGIAVALRLVASLRWDALYHGTPLI